MYTYSTLITKYLEEEIKKRKILNKNVYLMYIKFILIFTSKSAKKTHFFKSLHLTETYFLKNPL